MQTKLQQTENTNLINENNLRNVNEDTGKTFKRKERRGNPLKDKINDSKTNKQTLETSTEA
jgi:hypothetical protein